MRGLRNLKDNLSILPVKLDAATGAAAAVDAGNSTVSAGTTPASPAVNTDFTFAVSVRDQYNNSISGLAAGYFNITENGTGSLTVNSVAEDGATGNYTVTARHDTAETITITVTVSGVQVGSIAGVVIQDTADLSGFDVQLAVPGNKTAGVAFDLSITNAESNRQAAQGQFRQDALRLFRRG